jgi:predicted nucleotidyltransferase
MVIPSVKAAIKDILVEEFVVPSDILEAIKRIRNRGVAFKSSLLSTRESA